MSTAFRRPTIWSMIVDMHCIAACGISWVLLPKIWLGVFQLGFCSCSENGAAAGGRMVIPMPRNPSTGGGGRVHWVNPHAFGKFAEEPCGGCQAGGGGKLGGKGCGWKLGCEGGGGGKFPGKAGWGFLASHASPLRPSGTPHRWRRYLGGQSAHTHTSIYIPTQTHIHIHMDKECRL